MDGMDGIVKTLINFAETYKSLLDTFTDSENEPRITDKELNYLWNLSDVLEEKDDD